MNILILAFALISALYWLSMSVLWYRYMKTLPVFKVNDCLYDKANYPLVSVIIPACNEEESIEQAVRQLISQDYPQLEVIIVNDRSTDNTGVVLEKLKGQCPQLKVITIYDLPPNWLGKNHAIYRGEKEATGEWLIFTDADVMFSPRSMKQTVGYALEHKLDHLTIAPDLYYGGVFYRAFLAYFTFAVTATVMVTKKVGVGSFNLVKKSVYNEIGGYEVLATQPVDDMSFGRLVVNKGYKQGFGLPGKGFITVKWYKNLFATLKGFEKNLFASMNYKVSAVIGLCVYSLVTNVYPFVGLFFGSVWARALCGISLLSLFAVYNHLSKLFDISSSYVLFHPISALLYLGAVINSTVKALSRGGIEWRGTIYSLKELKNHK